MLCFQNSSASASSDAVFPQQLPTWCKCRGLGVCTSPPRPFVGDYCVLCVGEPISVLRISLAGCGSESSISTLTGQPRVLEFCSLQRRRGVWRTNRSGCSQSRWGEIAPSLQRRGCELFLDRRNGGGIVQATPATHEWTRVRVWRMGVISSCLSVCLVCFFGVCTTRS